MVALCPPSYYHTYFIIKNDSVYSVYSVYLVTHALGTLDVWLHKISNT